MARRTFRATCLRSGFGPEDRLLQCRMMTIRWRAGVGVRQLPLPQTPLNPTYGQRHDFASYFPLSFCTF